MRISDGSSDVCSSDLHHEQNDRELPRDDQSGQRVGSRTAGQSLREAEQPTCPDSFSGEELLCMIGVEGYELARAGRLHQGIRADLAGLCDEQVGELVGVVEDPSAPLATPRGARRGTDVVPSDLCRSEEQTSELQ